MAARVFGLQVRLPQSILFSITMAKTPTLAYLNWWVSELALLVRFLQIRLSGFRRHNTKFFQGGESHQNSTDALAQLPNERLTVLFKLSQLCRLASSRTLREALGPAAHSRVPSSALHKTEVVARYSDEPSVCPAVFLRPDAQEALEHCRERLRSHGQTRSYDWDSCRAEKPVTSGSHSSVGNERPRPFRLTFHQSSTFRSKSPNSRFCG
jgi:hypothetical protein